MSTRVTVVALTMLLALSSLASRPLQGQPTPPKVPFNNKPCESLTSADQSTLKNDKQGGLWFTKNGYYVVVSGRSQWREAVAHTIANKL